MLPVFHCRSAAASRHALSTSANKLRCSSAPTPVNTRRNVHESNAARRQPSSATRARRCTAKWRAARERRFLRACSRSTHSTHACVRPVNRATTARARRCIPACCSAQSFHAVSARESVNAPQRLKALVRTLCNRLCQAACACHAASTPRCRIAAKCAAALRACAGTAAKWFMV
jgi:hypothetical protein